MDIGKKKLVHGATRTIFFFVSVTHLFFLLNHYLQNIDDKYLDLSSIFPRWLSGVIFNVIVFIDLSIIIIGNNILDYWIKVSHSLLMEVDRRYKLLRLKETEIKKI